MKFSKFVDMALEQNPHNRFAKFNGNVEIIPDELQPFYRTYNPVNVQIEDFGGDVLFCPANELEELQSKYAYLGVQFVFATCNDAPIFFHDGRIYICAHGVRKPEWEELTADVSELLSLLAVKGGTQSNKCIMCSKPKSLNEFSSEHIIPYALGNHTLTIDSVCKDCNSKIGSRIDSLLVNNPLAIMFRETMELQGQSGKIPHLSDLVKHTSDGRAISIDANGIPKFMPLTYKNEDEDGSIMLHVEASTKEEGIVILKKIASRNGVILNDADFETSARFGEITQEQVTGRIDFSLDLNVLFLAAAKIAYEYAYYVLGDTYLSDRTADALRNMIVSYAYGSKEMVVDNSIGQFVMLMPEPIKDLIAKCGTLKINKNTSVIALLLGINEATNSTIVNISILGSPFNFSVKISDKSIPPPYKKDGMTVLVNGDIIFPLE
ncbi:MAG: HNH endonuclease [Gracilibacteraceae bacterium]|jgi:hypothetical protein|nr:HNH endonuclease [Gracilibacteraceae bacterium]